MSDRRDPWGDGPHDADADIRDALHRAVDDVEPAYRLDQIRHRTTPGSEEGTMQENARTWLVGAAGAVLATAAVIVTVAVLGNGDDDASTPTAGEPSASAPADPSPSAPATSAEPSPTDGGDPSQDGGGTEVTVPVYYTVDTPLGPRLVREFRRVGASGDDVGARVTAAVDAAVSLPPADPDYATSWPTDTSVTAEQAGGGWTVTLTSADGDLASPRDGAEADAASAMSQQVVYTVQAVLQERVDVTLLGGTSASDAGPLFAGPDGPTSATDENAVLALMNVTNPVQGQSVRGDVLMADGRSNGPEATVIWDIRAGDADGEVVDEGFTTAEGWMDALYPWAVEIDVSDLEPGTYTFVARNDDPTGGAEGVGDSADSKTFVIE